MKKKDLKRDVAVFPIGSVMKLTELSARQIRYYEEQKLIFPKRNEGKTRQFSLNDIDRLLEIKEMLDASFTIKEIHKQFNKEGKPEQVSDEKIRIALYEDMMRESGLHGRH
ncbi:MerR family transcriptional regulator [Vagococcus silagei]|nr:MerR family transcriptional regulator [Vagococcus silagei]